MTADGNAAVDQAILEIATRVADCVDAQEEVTDTLNDQSDQLTDAKLEIRALKAKNSALEKRLDNLDAEIKVSKEEISLVRKEVVQNAQALKIANLVIDGLPELDGENCKERVTDVLKSVDNKFTMKDILATYRVGQKSEDAIYARPILVKLGDPMIKQCIMDNKNFLMKHPTYSKVFLNDDLPLSIKRERQTLREIGKRAHQLGYKNVKTTSSKVIIDGKSYCHSELHLLPSNLQMPNIKTCEIGYGIGFQGGESFLSNFYKVTFKMQENTFTSAEQAYFFFKARTCKNEEAALKFLSMADPLTIKKDGDQIPSKAVWEANKEGFMRSIVYNKFAQNESILEKLLNTGESPLYECTQNRWWGCGLRFDAPEWNNFKAVPGLNKLGKLLMEVRAALRNSNRKGAAQIMSPGALIRSITKQSEEIERKAKAPGEMVMEISNIDSHLSSEESVDILDEEEESVGMQASSDVSTTSTKSSGSNKTKRPRALDLTNTEGRIDISKIKNWSLPKIRKPKRSRSGSDVGVRATTRSQVLKNTDLEQSIPPSMPKAHSTPQAKGDSSRANQSVLDQVRDKLNSTKRRKVSASKNTSKTQTRKKGK